MKWRRKRRSRLSDFWRLQVFIIMIVILQFKLASYNIQLGYRLCKFSLSD
ncbi:hypothetical protein RintRC_0228 [Richelia intracellularis]|nr:hypothetical protein RintRC_0228 [Richelia intracellularis]